MHTSVGTPPWIPVLNEKQETPPPLPETVKYHHDLILLLKNRAQPLTVFQAISCIDTYLNAVEAAFEKAHQRKPNLARMEDLVLLGQYLDCSQINETRLLTGVPLIDGRDICLRLLRRHLMVQCAQSQDHQTVLDYTIPGLFCSKIALEALVKKLDEPPAVSDVQYVLQEIHQKLQEICNSYRAIMQKPNHSVPEKLALHRFITDRLSNVVVNLILTEELLEVSFLGSPRTWSQMCQIFGDRMGMMTTPDMNLYQ